MLGGITLTSIVIIIVCLLIAITIHEFMHAYVGHKLGDDTAFEHGRVSFNPLQHIDPFMTVLLPAITLLLFQVPILAAKPVPFNPHKVRYGEYGAALLAFAGPLSNLVLAFVSALLLNAFHFGTFLEVVLTFFVQLNVALFVFNLLPIPPLDGSRVLYAFAPEPVQDFMRRIEPFGLIIVFALIFLGGFGSLIGNLNNLVLSWLP